MATVVTAKVECLSVTLGAQRGHFVHRHAANRIFRHGSVFRCSGGGDCHTTTAGDYSGAPAFSLARYLSGSFLNSETNWEQPRPVICAISRSGHLRSIRKTAAIPSSKFPRRLLRLVGPVARNRRSTTFCELDATGLPRGGSRFQLHEAISPRNLPTPFRPRPHRRRGRNGVGRSEGLRACRA